MTATRARRGRLALIVAPLLAVASLVAGAGDGSAAVLIKNYVAADTVKANDAQVYDYSSGVAETSNTPAAFDAGTYDQTERPQTYGDITANTTTNAWWNNQWRTRRCYTVTNTEAYATTNVPVTITFDSTNDISNGWLAAGAADLRATSGGATPTLLSFYAEGAWPSATSNVYVKVPSLAAGASTQVCLYYNNPTAGPSPSSLVNKYKFWGRQGAGPLTPAPDAYGPWTSASVPLGAFSTYGLAPYQVNSAGAADASVPTGVNTHVADNPYYVPAFGGFGYTVNNAGMPSGQKLRMNLYVKDVDDGASGPIPVSYRWSLTNATLFANIDPRTAYGPNTLHMLSTGVVTFVGGPGGTLLQILASTGSNFPLWPAVEYIDASTLTAVAGTGPRESLTSANGVTLSTAASATLPTGTNWWDTAWGHRRCFQVTNPETYAVTNLPVTITYDSSNDMAAGLLQAGASDLRATTGAAGQTPLTFYAMGPWPSSSSVVKVVIPSLAAGKSAPVCLYYDNAAAGPSPSTATANEKYLMRVTMGPTPLTDQYGSWTTEAGAPFTLSRTGVATTIVGPGVNTYDSTVPTGTNPNALDYARVASTSGNVNWSIPPGASFTGRKIRGTVYFAELQGLATHPLNILFSNSRFYNRASATLAPNVGHGYTDDYTTWSGTGLLTVGSATAAANAALNAFEVWEFSTLTATPIEDAPANVNVAQFANTGASAWWNSSWNSRRCYTIKNYETTPVTNLPVKITFDSTGDLLSGALQPGASDLRAATSGAAPAAVPFYAEGPWPSTQSAVYAQVPSLAAGATTSLCLYYGNASAGASPSSLTNKQKFIARISSNMSGTSDQYGAWAPISQAYLYDPTGGSFPYHWANNGPGIPDASVPPGTSTAILQHIWSSTNPFYRPLYWQFPGAPAVAGQPVKVRAYMQMQSNMGTSTFASVSGVSVSGGYVNPALTYGSNVIHMFEGTGTWNAGLTYTVGNVIPFTFAVEVIDISNVAVTSGGLIETSYAPNGTWTTPVIDTGANGVYGLGTITCTIPTGTTCTFQVATSNAPGGPFTFVGPDGTAATSYAANSTAPLSYVHDGERYVQLQVTETTTGGSTPVFTNSTIFHDLTQSTRASGGLHAVTAAAASTGGVSWAARIKGAVGPLVTKPATALAGTGSTYGTSAFTAKFDTPAVSCCSATMYTVTGGTATGAAGPPTVNTFTTPTGWGLSLGFVRTNANPAADVRSTVQVKPGSGVVVDIPIAAVLP